MELSKDELEQILTEVTKEYEEVVKSEKAKMEKSALPMNKEESSEETSMSEESSKPEPPKAEDAMPEGSSEKIVKADEEVAAPEAEAAPEQPVQEDPAQAMDQDMGGDELLQLYSGLSPEHLAAHWMAASQALFQSMQGESPQEMVADVGAAPEAAAPEVAAPVEAPIEESKPPMFKAEDTKEFKELKKNFDELKSQNSTLEKSLGTLTEKLSEKLRIPARKGIDADTVISKSEPVVEEKVISKSEVVDLLKSKAKEKLSDQDKQKIFKFTMNPTVTPELKEFLGLK